MQNLAIVALLTLLVIVVAPYLYEAVLRVIRNWSRTTTIFFAIFFVVLAILIISRW